MPVLVEYDDDIRLKNIRFGQIDIERSMVKHSDGGGTNLTKASRQGDRIHRGFLVDDVFGSRLYRDLHVGNGQRGVFDDNAGLR
jgi:hypothetical protein